MMVWISLLAIMLSLTIWELMVHQSSRKALKPRLKLSKQSDVLAQLLLVGSMDNANVELTSTCDSAKGM